VPERADVKLPKRRGLLRVQDGPKSVGKFNVKKKQQNRTGAAGYAVYKAKVLRVPRVSAILVMSFVVVSVSIW
jgi:hypothetical protein